MIVRSIGIVLLSLFGADLAVPFLAPDLRAELPACCRRDGKHHCAMMDMLEGTDGSPKVIPSRCPFFPNHGVAANIEGATPTLPAQSSVNLAFTERAAKAQTEALYRISHSRSRQKRGPPFLS